ncbi:MAG: DUF3450 family protein [Spirochaetales bacterium]|nr:DUF3450 family protein [Spirochaetales bacterium]
MLRKILVFVFFLFFVVFSPLIQGEEEPAPDTTLNPGYRTRYRFQYRGGEELQQNTTKTLEELVAKWVDLRRELTEEKESWEEEKAHLEQEQDLLHKEQESLQNEITIAREESLSIESKRSSLVIREKILSETVNNCLPALQEAEKDLRVCRKVIPSSLLSPSVKNAFDRLQNGLDQSFTQRLQLIVSLCGEIERLQNNVHVVKEVFNIEAGSSREMDVVYLGLARGFAVSQDNAIAGVGVPAENGWQWEWRNEIASEVRKAVDFHSRDKTADFVHLPMRVKDIK